jgi:hypothetical protein
MSEALSLSERIAARLERLAEMDLAAAEHVQAQLLASTEPKATAELSRAYQRASRTLRQTLMLQMKHARDQAAAEAQAEKDAEPAPSMGDLAYDRLVNARIADIQGAVARVAAAAHPDRPRLQRETLDRLDVELDEWADEETFIDARLDDLIVAACEAVGLPADLAHQWNQLPEPPATFDPATAPPDPIPDTG